MQDIADTAQAGTEFKPYTVTSNLGTFTTTPEGGINLQLSYEQQQMADALFADARAMFARGMEDPTQRTQALFEDIRKLQRPEERRFQQGLNQGLFSTGRGGISTGEFGGTREEFMAQKARMEASDKAALLARDAINKEQQAEREAAAKLLASGFLPQEQAIGLFNQAQIPAQLASQGRIGGTELATQANIAGLEGLLGMGKVGATTTTEFLKAIIKALVLKTVCLIK